MTSGTEFLSQDITTKHTYFVFNFTLNNMNTRNLSDTLPGEISVGLLESILMP